LHCAILPAPASVSQNLVEKILTETNAKTARPFAKISAKVSGF